MERPDAPILEDAPLISDLGNPPEFNGKVSGFLPMFLVVANFMSATMNYITHVFTETEGVRDEAKTHRDDANAAATRGGTFKDHALTARSEARLERNQAESFKNSAAIYAALASGGEPSFPGDDGTRF